MDFILTHPCLKVAGRPALITCLGEGRLNKWRLKIEWPKQ